MSQFLIMVCLLSLSLNALVIYLYLKKDIEVVFNESDSFELDTLRLAIDKIILVERKADSPPLDSYLAVKVIANTASKEILEKRALK